MKHLTVHTTSAAHGKTNPNWTKYADRVFYGTGRTKWTIDMVVIIGGTDTMTGWDDAGRYVTVRNVVGTMPLV
jgi:hypothetical protein